MSRNWSEYDSVVCRKKYVNDDDKEKDTRMEIG